MTGGAQNNQAAMAFILLAALLAGAQLAQGQQVVRCGTPDLRLEQLAAREQSLQQTRVSVQAQTGTRFVPTTVKGACSSPAPHRRHLRKPPACVIG